MGSVGGAEGIVGAACGAAGVEGRLGVGEPGTAGVGRAAAEVDEGGTLLSFISSVPEEGCRL